MQIEMDRMVEVKLRTALRAAGKRECGGMLFAEQLEPGKFRIVDISFDTESGEHAHFKRTPEAHKAALDAFFERTGRDFKRYNHLGEWHSHPSFAVRPSLEDVTTMKQVVSLGPITFAALLIVRLRFGLWIDYSLSVFARGYDPFFMRLGKRVRL